MPKFHVKDTFTVAGRPHFVLAGSIVEGEIRPGMFVRIPFNSGLVITARIDSIDFVRRSGGHKGTCLCIRYTDPEELEMWGGLNLGNETFEVTAEGSD